MQRFSNVPGDPTSLPSDSVIGFAVAPDGTLWIGTHGGLARWDGTHFQRVPLPGTTQAVNRLYMERNGGTLWVSDVVGDAFGVDANGQARPQPWQKAVSKRRVMGVLLHDRNGRYWLDTDGGLGLSTAGTDISSVPVYSLSAHGLVRRNWIAAYEDREGGLWFAALEGGLWHLPPHWDTLRSWPPTAAIHSR